MKLEIKTLTPVWTGGVEAGKVDRIHETGVIGSLRWWMEALVRGLGGQVNDPTQNERSGFDQKSYDASSKAADERARLREAGLCDVSQIFGATGWRRRFRLAIQDTTTPDNTVASPIQAERSYTDKKGQKRTPKWYFPSKPRSGQLAIQIQALAQDFQPEIMAGLIQFVADWAGLGARAQMGFGVIEPVNERAETQSLYNWLVATAGTRLYPHLPSLRNVFLARIKHKESSRPFTEQTTFNLKYDLRRLFAGNEGLRHFIMGTVKDERMAAKIKISRPYGDGLVRMWGWIPEEAASIYTGSWNRNSAVDAICQHLKANYSLQIWREMNSPRNTGTPVTSAKVFLHSLLGLKENADGA